MRGPIVPTTMWFNVEETFFVACIQRECVNGTLPNNFACALSDQSLANGDARYDFVYVST